MPRKRHRFGALHDALKASGYSATSGPAGEYLNFLKGTNKLTVARRPSAAALTLFNVGVIPFGAAINTATNAINAYETSMTAVAEAIRNTFDTAAPLALYGIQQDLTKVLPEPGFYSAVAHLTIAPVGSTKVQATSQITKRSYKKLPTRSGGVPYGRSLSVTTDDKGQSVTDISKETEEAARIGISTALKGATSTSFILVGVTFSPEIYNETKLENKAINDTIKGVIVPAN